MAVETAADRAMLLADWGVTATFSPLSGGTTSVVGIFDNQTESMEVGGSVAFLTTQPRFTCATSSVPGAVEGDGIVIEGVSYTVSVPMDDGTGMTELALEKV